MPLAAYRFVVPFAFDRKSLMAAICSGSILGQSPILGGNSIEILVDYDETIARLVGDIDRAESHVHLLYQWTAPIHLVISQLFMLGDQPMQAFVGGRYYFESPDGGPEWGIRAGITLLFPKG